MTPRAADGRLAELLALQADALRSGRLEELAAMAGQLEEALGDLGPGIEAATLARLRSRAAENARLLAAARAGVAHVEALRRAPASLSTYDSRGRVAAVPAVGGRTLARR